MKPFGPRFGTIVSLVLALAAIAGQWMSMHHAGQHRHALARIATDPTQRDNLQRVAAWHRLRASQCSYVGLVFFVLAIACAYLSRADRNRVLRITFITLLVLYVLSTLILN